MRTRHRFRLLRSAMLYALLATAACGGSSSPTSPSPAPAPAPAPSPAPAPPPAPAPTPSPPPQPPVVTVGPGQHRVGTDVQPGRYFADPSSGCYWERQSGLGGTADERIAFKLVDYDAAQWVVDILPADRGFLTRTTCGVWFSTPRPSTPSSIPPGVWLIGEQILPGMYRTSASAGCYWERLGNFTGEPAAVIASDLVSSSGLQFVTIAASDTGFRSDAACGTWARTQAAAASR